jgi:hypothetical protein
VAAMHQLNFKSILAAKNGPKLPFTIGKKKGSQGLRPKIQVEFQRQTSKQYQRCNPFKPIFLESEYLEEY